MRASFFTLAAVAAPALAALPPTEFGFPVSANSTQLTVMYTANKNATLIEPGHLLGSNISTSQPVLALNPKSAKSLASATGPFVVLMIDPDALVPENPTARSILHMLVYNVASTTATSSSGLNGQKLLNVNNGTVVASYISPGPPQTSSAHRYIIYTFSQPSNFKIPASFSGFGGQNRTQFNINTFVSEAGLTSSVLAVNYFYVSRQSGVSSTFIALPGGTFPGGNGQAIFANAATTTTKTNSTRASNSTRSGTTTVATTAGGSKAVGGAGMTALLAVGLAGLVSLL